MNKNIETTAQAGVEKISKFTLWALIGISLVVLALFILIGYDTPYEENPKFVDPQLTDALLCWTYFLIAGTAIATVVSVIYGAISGGNKSKVEEKGLLSKTGLIAWGTFIVSIVIGVAMGIAGKDEVLLINGKDWNNPTDIILTDASMVSILVLTVVTVIATVFSMVTNKK
ncbi:MAG: hypothetical protein KBT29_00265 [Prevotellaceae bacterium]|nr:hypothetical protein [Candidatus Minthosoma caballi]